MQRWRSAAQRENHSALFLSHSALDTHVRTSLRRLLLSLFEELRPSSRNGSRSSTASNLQVPLVVPLLEKQVCDSSRKALANFPRFVSTPNPSDPNPKQNQKVMSGEPRLFRNKLESHFVNENILLYRVNIESGLEFVLVDISSRIVQRGSKQTIGELLREASGAEVDEVFEEYLKCKRKPSKTKFTGDESSVEFVNQTEHEISIFWISDQGKQLPYGKVKAQQTKVQHSYQGHRWICYQSEKVIGIYKVDRAPRKAILSFENEELLAHLNSKQSKSYQDRCISPNARFELFVRDHDMHMKKILGTPSEEEIRSNQFEFEEIRLTEDSNEESNFSRDFSFSNFVGMDQRTYPSELPHVFFSPNSKFAAGLLAHSLVCSDIFSN